MKNKLLFYFIALIIVPSFSYGQVTFTSIPMDSQLVARNLNTDLGTFNIQGLVDSVNTPYDTICLKIYRDAVLIDSIYQGLYYHGDSAPFNLSFQILAELHEYSVSVYGIKNTIQTLDTAIHALLAGDVYIIDGQSNAFAEERDGQNADTNKSEFIRVFGNSDSSTAGLLSNLQWFRGEGNGGLTENGHTGQWGLRLGRLLIDSIKTPVAIFNGACGGTPISYYERPADYKKNINSNYGRLYYRLTYTGLQNNVRAIIWSQGETDAYNGTTTATYINEFDTLEKSFRQDFPGFVKTYIFQTKTQIVYSPFYNLMAIEEAQREIAVEHDSDIEIMSTSALKPDAGGLHFDYTGGYEEFGNRIYQLIARDIYGVIPNREIDAPMVTEAYMSDSTTLIIKESADSLLQHNNLLSLQTLSPKPTYEIENAMGATIDTIYTHKNKVILKLSKYPGSGVTVSYFAPIYDTGTNWLTNTNGIDMVCFYKYPVADSIAISAGTANYAVLSATMVYPNPFHSFTNINLSENGKYLVELYDLAGRKIQADEFTGIHYQLSAEGLANGVYFIRVFDGSNTLIGITKIVVH